MSFASKSVVCCSVLFLVSPLLTGCGESKVSQCNKLIQVANKATMELQGINKGNNPDKVAQLNTIADKLDRHSKDMQGLQIKDEKLQGFQTRFVKLYQQTGTGSREVAAGVKSKNLKAATQALKQMQTGVGQEQALVNEVNQYCQGK